MIRSGIFILLGIVLLYGLISAYPLISGPQIVLETPEDGATLPDGVVFFSGKALRANEVFLNGAPLLMDTEGHFSSTFVLPTGSAILEVSAHDRMNRVYTKRIQVFTPSTTTIQ